MNGSRRITQKDVAEAAGVQRSTVSLALNHHPSIPAVTRERIERAAAKLGYVRDPMLSALAAYRSRVRPAAYHGTLGWVARTTSASAWRAIPGFVSYFRGAEACARRHGYEVEILDRSDLATDWPGVGRIARARGIRGLLVCPQPEPDTRIETFPWEHFSAVTFGFSLSHPQLHVIAPNQFGAMATLVTELRRRGYCRIGLALDADVVRRTEFHYLGGYLAHAMGDRGRRALPPCLHDTAPGRQLHDWLERYRPDAIITSNPDLPAELAASGLVAPRDLGVVCISKRTPDHPTAGIVDANAQLGEIAVDLLVAMLHRGERGPPALPQRVLVPGVWSDGDTVRSVI